MTVKVSLKVMEALMVPFDVWRVEHSTLSCLVATAWVQYYTTFLQVMLE